LHSTRIHFPPTKARARTHVSKVKKYGSSQGTSIARLEPSPFAAIASTLAHRSPGRVPRRGTRGASLHLRFLLRVSPVISRPGSHPRVRSMHRGARDCPGRRDGGVRASPRAVPRIGHRHARGFRAARRSFFAAARHLSRRLARRPPRPLATVSSARSPPARPPHTRHELTTLSPPLFRSRSITSTTSWVVTSRPMRTLPRRCTA